MTNDEVAALVPGDIIIAVNPGKWLGLTLNKEYKVEYSSAKGFIGFTDNDGDFRHLKFLISYGIAEVFKKWSPIDMSFSDIPSDVTEIVRNGVRYAKVVTVSWKAI